MRRNTSELIGLIKNDSTILINEELCDWCNTLDPKYHKSGGKYVYANPLEYNFYKASFKPDSSFAWFRTKKWYKE
jgi:hypothetical protein